MHLELLWRSRSLVRLVVVVMPDNQLKAFVSSK